MTASVCVFVKSFKRNTNTTSYYTFQLDVWSHVEQRALSSEHIKPVSQEAALELGVKVFNWEGGIVHIHNTVVWYNKVRPLSRKEGLDHS